MGSKGWHDPYIEGITQVAILLVMGVMVAAASFKHIHDLAEARRRRQAGPSQWSTCLRCQFGWGRIRLW